MGAASDLTEALSDLGLTSMGHFAIASQDDLPLQAGTVILIGPDEPRFWAIFQQSDIFRDGAPDPLDRWSRDVLDPLARRFDGHVRYPFGGPPFHPFHSWALRTGRSWSSPIGFLVHDIAGLFASYRGALIVPWRMKVQTSIKPCDTCIGQPCKTACPVGAFAADGYNVDTCKGWLRRPEGSTCMAQGCAARRACPVGQSSRLPAQAAFHMEAFL